MDASTKEKKDEKECPKTIPERRFANGEQVIVLGDNTVKTVSGAKYEKDEWWYDLKTDTEKREQSVSDLIMVKYIPPNSSNPFTGFPVGTKVYGLWSVDQKWYEARIKSVKCFQNKDFYYTVQFEDSSNHHPLKGSHVRTREMYGDGKVWKGDPFAVLHWTETEPEAIPGQGWLEKFDWKLFQCAHPRKFFSGDKVVLQGNTTVYSIYEWNYDNGQWWYTLKVGDTQLKRVSECLLSIYIAPPIVKEEKEEQKNTPIFDIEVSPNFKTPEFKNGSAVSARYHGNMQWYDATIINFDPVTQTYDILFYDNRRQSNTLPSEIKAKSNMKYTVDDRVSIWYSPTSTYQEGIIGSVNEKDYLYYVKTENHPSYKVSGFDVFKPRENISNSYRFMLGDKVEARDKETMTWRSGVIINRTYTCDFDYLYDVRWDKFNYWESTSQSNTAPYDIRSYKPWLTPEICLDALGLSAVLVLAWVVLTK